MKFDAACAALVAALVLFTSATAGAVDNLPARKMGIKDHPTSGKQRLRLGVKDAGVAVADGYASSPVDVTLYARSEATGSNARWASTCTTLGPGKLLCAGGKSKLTVLPGRLRLNVRGNVGFELDGLVDQFPVTMALRIRTASGDVDYCVRCDDSGSDVVSKDGSDGKRLFARSCDVSSCPLVGTAVCCQEVADICYGGFDSVQCALMGFEVGDDGSVCDASGSCVASPGTPGDCCELSFGCANHSATMCASFPGNYSSSSVCDASGSCVP